MKKIRIFLAVLSAILLLHITSSSVIAQHVHTPDRPIQNPTLAPIQLPDNNDPIIRKNIYDLSPEERIRLINAINTLKANGTYDLFMQMHMDAMMTFTPFDDPVTDRNAGHRGPIFLPWHRAFIWEFEQQLRAVDPSVSLPYWAFENENPNATPLIFSSQYFGGDGNIVQEDMVTNSPFTWVIIRRIAREENGQRTLPNQTTVNEALQHRVYDTFPFDEQSLGFRSAIEGWTGTNAPWGMHNQVHRYIGGDMLPDETMTRNSVNDPIFWLVHANIDRLWWQWQQTNGITNYQPISAGPEGHNVNDVMQFLPRRGTPADTFDIRNDMRYIYN